MADLGWLSDPFKGLSDLQIADKSGHYIEPPGSMCYKSCWTPLHSWMVIPPLMGNPCGYLKSSYFWGWNSHPRSTQGSDMRVLVDPIQTLRPLKEALTNLSDILLERVARMRQMYGIRYTVCLVYLHLPTFGQMADFFIGKCRYPHPRLGFPTPNGSQWGHNHRRLLHGAIVFHSHKPGFLRGGLLGSTGFLRLL